MAASARLVEYIQRTGTFGFMSGSMVTRFRHQAAAPEACTLTVTDAEVVSSGSGDPSEFIATWSVPLAQLSPVLTIREEDELGRIVAITTRGDSSVHRTVTNHGQQSAMQEYEFSLTRETRAQADTLAGLLADAIRACGGTPATPVVVARLAAADSAEKAGIRATLGLDFSAVERSAILESCYAQLRDKLKSPSSAKFDAVESALITKSDDGKLIVLGALEAQNGFGAMKKSNYTCSLEKLGAKYLPTSVVIFDR